MERLREAVDVIHKSLEGNATLDRELAGALWVLGTSVNDNYHSWRSNGNPWRSGRQNEIMELMEAIEGVFVGTSESPQ